MRRSNTLLLLFSVSTLLLLLTLVDAGRQREQSAPLLQLRARLVGELGLTDLALFTEARYTRHLSQSDLHSAFQNHPMAMEHFPSGSLLSPPAQVTRGSLPPPSAEGQGTR